MQSCDCALLEVRLGSALFCGPSVIDVMLLMIMRAMRPACWQCQTCALAHMSTWPEDMFGELMITANHDDW